MTDLFDLRRRVDNLARLRERRKGEYDAAMRELRKLGFDSIAQAQRFVKQESKRLKKSYRMYAKTLAEIESEYAKKRADK
jgi:hypothetical protein